MIFVATAIAMSSSIVMAFLFPNPTVIVQLISLSKMYLEIYF